MFFSQLKTYCKNTLLALNCLSLLILLSVPVYADETLVETETQTIQEQNKQQNKLSDEKQKYSFLSKPLLSNASNQITKKDTSANKDALNVFLGLIVILVMIFSLAWFMKKMGYSNVTGQGQLKIIASLNLGQKEKIVLIQVGKQQLLVGMTATQINTLHVLDEVLEETDIKQFGTTGNGAFASKFSELLKHKQNTVK
ncbi:MAG: flagellar biosynthetic protein FliO [Gammaproteobacteria bacterium]|nr:flagellar biosynthetic protein FliO [Gammaproteobacteria bacterium]